MNKIVYVEGLDNKKDLLHISLEDNCITTLVSKHKLINFSDFY